MNQPPFDSNLNDLIHRWCQWCVDRNRVIPLQEWMGYTLPIEDVRVIEKCYTEKPARRVDLRAILADPEQRKDLMVRAIIATQAVAGIETTPEQAEAAYRKVLEETRR